MTMLQQEFRTRGFVALRGFLSEQEVGELRGELARYKNEVVPSLPPQDVLYENKGDSGSMKQLIRMFEHDAWFRQMIVGERFRSVAEELLEGPVVEKNLQWFNKPPRIGGPTPPHQDGYYFMIEPQDAVTMWLALDEVTEENGCVRYVSGSHLRGIRTHARSNVLGFSQGITDFGPDDTAHEVPMPAKPGDLLVHHCLTIHRAEPNLSERGRQAMGLIYYSAAAREDTEQHERYQKSVREQWAAEGRI